MPILTRWVRTMLAAALVVAVPCAALAAQATAATRRPPAPQPVRIRTGIMVDAGQAVPLKLYDLELISQPDSSQRFPVQTDLEGAAELRVPPGAYVLRSVKPATVSGRTYRWEIAVAVAAGRPTTVQVTSSNAIARGARPTRAYANPVELHNALQSGVVRVNAGLGHGTGFMVDGFPGLIVTNDHVVGTSPEVIISVDSVTSVFAQTLVRDQDADLAILRINPSVCPDCLGLRLARPRDGEVLVRPGEQLVAIGYPLSQKLSITTGIASSVRDGAIISDVNVNEGNSGGPMLNMFGDVVGVNTFVESGRIGAGVSGAIAASVLLELLAKSEKELASAAVPRADLLPVMPRGRYPVSLLREIADTAKAIQYGMYTDIDAQNFKIQVSTPVAFVVRSRAAENEVASARRQRERSAGVSAGESYADQNELRDWREYVGDETAPVVGFKVEPKDGLEGEGLAGKIGGVLGRARRGQGARREFKGDVRGVTFTREGRMVRYVQGGHAPIRVDESGMVATKDVADFGYYTLLPEVFEPDSTGKPPVIGVEIADLKNPNLPRRITLPPAVVAAIWNDFVPYYKSRFPDRKVVVATLPTPAAKPADTKANEPAKGQQADTAKVQPPPGAQ